MPKINNLDLGLELDQLFEVRVGQLTFEDLPWLSLIWPLRKVKHDVLRLEVSVYNLLALHGHERTCDLLYDVVSLCIAECESVPPLQQLFERATIAIVHDDVEPVLRLDNVEDLHDVWVAQLPQNLRLALEELPRLSVLLNALAVNSLCAEKLVLVLNVIALEGVALDTDAELLCDHVFFDLLHLEVLFVVAGVGPEIHGKSVTEY